MEDCILEAAVPPPAPLLLHCPPAPLTSNPSRGGAVASSPPTSVFRPLRLVSITPLLHLLLISSRITFSHLIFASHFRISFSHRIPSASHSLQPMGQQGTKGGRAPYTDTTRQQAWAHGGSGQRARSLGGSRRACPILMMMSLMMRPADSDSHPLSRIRPFVISSRIRPLFRMCIPHPSRLPTGPPDLRGRHAHPPLTHQPRPPDGATQDARAPGPEVP